MESSKGASGAKGFPSKGSLSVAIVGSVSKQTKCGWLVVLWFPFCANHLALVWYSGIIFGRMFIISHDFTPSPSERLPRLRTADTAGLPRAHHFPLRLLVFPYDFLKSMRSIPSPVVRWFAIGANGW